MIKVASVFAQVFSLINRRHFARTVHQLGAERGAKGFTCWEQLVAMLFAASTIGRIYKDRWQIELFFKAIKQNLKIKTFERLHPNVERNCRIFNSSMAINAVQI